MECQRNDGILNIPIERRHEYSFMTTTRFMIQFVGLYYERHDSKKWMAEIMLLCVKVVTTTNLDEVDEKEAFVLLRCN